MKSEGFHPYPENTIVTIYPINRTEDLKLNIYKIFKMKYMVFSSYFIFFW